MTKTNTEGFVRTFARGLQVLEALGNSASGMTINSLVTETGLSRSVITRYLSTLMELDYVRLKERNYAPTPKVLSLGLSYLYSLPFWRQAQFELEELSQKIKQSCAMAILDDNDIVYVVRVPSYRILRAGPTLGSRLPANVVSMGRAILAESDEEVVKHFFSTAPLKRLTSHTLTDKAALQQELKSVFSKGYAWVEGELDETICGLAVALKDFDGRVWAAINVSLPANQIDEKTAVDTYLSELRETAAKIRAAF